MLGPGLEFAYMQSPVVGLQLKVTTSDESGITMSFCALHGAHLFR
jgi:hypothetical protein